MRLIQREGQASGAGNPRMAALQSERIRVEQEIERLVDALAQANSVLLSYVNARVAELDGRRQELSREISQLNAEAVAPETVEELARQLGAWEDVDFGRQAHDG